MAPSPWARQIDRSILHQIDRSILRQHARAATRRATNCVRLEAQPNFGQLDAQDRLELVADERNDNTDERNG